MSTPDPHRKKQSSRRAAERGKAQREWAEGLRKMYDEVVAEPLPQSFMDLIEQLDPVKKD